MNNTTINYQPWLQAVLTVARHYRIESSEERIRLELNWNQNQGIDDVLMIMTRQVGCMYARSILVLICSILGVYLLWLALKMVKSV